MCKKSALGSSLEKATTWRLVVLQPMSKSLGALMTKKKQSGAFICQGVECVEGGSSFFLLQAHISNENGECNNVACFVKESHGPVRNGEKINGRRWRIYK